MIPFGGSEHSDYSEPSNLMGRYWDILTENHIYISPAQCALIYIKYNQETPHHRIISSATEEVSRLSLGGLSLSSVTAQVGKQIGVMSAGTGQYKTTEQPTLPTLLHKRIYEKNLTVNNNVRMFFKVSFFPTISTISKIESKTQKLQFRLNV